MLLSNVGEENRGILTRDQSRLAINWYLFPGLSHAHSSNLHLAGQIFSWVVVSFLSVGPRLIIVKETLVLVWPGLLNAFTNLVYQFLRINLLWVVTLPLSCYQSPSARMWTVAPFFPRAVTTIHSLRSLAAKRDALTAPTPLGIGGKQIVRYLINIFRRPIGS